MFRDDLPDEYRTCIYRVVQEALHNVTRHSQGDAGDASRCGGKQRQCACAFRTTAHGFQPRLEKGMGILGMEERVRHLGGSFSDRFCSRATAPRSRLPCPCQEPAHVPRQASHAQV